MYEVPMPSRVQDATLTSDAYASDTTTINIYTT